MLAYSDTFLKPPQHERMHHGYFFNLSFAIYPITANRPVNKYLLNIGYNLKLIPELPRIIVLLDEPFIFITVPELFSENFSGRAFRKSFPEIHEFRDLEWREVHR